MLQIDCGSQTLKKLIISLSVCALFAMMLLLIFLDAPSVDSSSRKVNKYVESHVIGAERSSLRSAVGRRVNVGVGVKESERRRESASRVGTAKTLKDNRSDNSGPRLPEAFTIRFDLSYPDLEEDQSGTVLFYKSSDVIRRQRLYPHAFREVGGKLTSVNIPSLRVRSFQALVPLAVNETYEVIVRSKDRQLQSEVYTLKTGDRQHQSYELPEQRVLRRRLISGVVKGIDGKPLESTVIMAVRDPGLITEVQRLIYAYTTFYKIETAFKFPDSYRFYAEQKPSRIVDEATGKASIGFKRHRIEVNELELPLIEFGHSDSSGRFSVMEPVGSNSNLKIYAFHSEFQSKVLKAQTNMKFVLAMKRELKVLCLDDKEQPIENATVVVYHRSELIEKPRILWTTSTPRKASANGLKNSNFNFQPLLQRVIGGPPESSQIAGYEQVWLHSNRHGEVVFPQLALDDGYIFVLTASNGMIRVPFSLRSRDAKTEVKVRLQATGHLKIQSGRSLTSLRTGRMRATAKSIGFSHEYRWPLHLSELSDLPVGRMSLQYYVDGKRRTKDVVVRKGVVTVLTID